MTLADEIDVTVYTSARDETLHKERSFTDVILTRRFWYVEIHFSHAAKITETDKVNNLSFEEMKLEDFIRETLTEIVKGTLAAGEDLKDDVLLCCHAKEYNGYPSVSYAASLKDRQAPVTVVGFKVKLEVEHCAEADGSVGGCFLNVVSGNAKGNFLQASGTEHEVTFSVPLVWKQKGR